MKRPRGGEPLRLLPQTAAEDLQVKWLPASVILTKLSIFGKVQVNPHTQLVLVQALEKYGFGTRTNEQETTEYEVVDIQLYQ